MADGKKIFTIPNILSMVRILMIPFIVWAYCIDWFYLSAILIVLSGLTDIVDGYIARRFNMVSPLGKALDPIADKLTIGIILISLCVETPSVIPLVVIFAVKEVCMGIEGLLIIKHTGTTYSAKWYGKLSTVMLYATAVAIILWTDIQPIVRNVLIMLCVAVVVFAFVMYTIMNAGRIKHVKAQKTNESILE